MMIRYWSPELETMAWENVEAWQAEHISMQLPAIQNRSRFYAQQLATFDKQPAIRSLDDLQALPFTTKDQIRQAQAEADAETPFGTNQAACLNDIVQAVTSSGTSGVPMYYPATRADVAMWTDTIAQTLFTGGVRSNDIVAHLVGLPGVAGGMPYAEGFRALGATLCWLGGFPTERILREMRRMRVNVLHATASFATYLSDAWAAVEEEMGIESHLTKVLCGGEPGLAQPAIRAKIQQGLGTGTPRELMGMSDVIPCMWGDCDVADGMHFNGQRYVALELVDPDTGEQRPWCAGATGELVYTTFQREAAPLVRYRSRDHVQVVAMECSCGRSSPRIRCIGRTDDMLIYKGMNIFPTALRDVVAQEFAGRLTPTLRIWKPSKDTVRFDHAIPMDVEATVDLPGTKHATIGRELEEKVRAQLQVRVEVNVLPNGGLRHDGYKNALVAVKGN